MQFKVGYCDTRPRLWAALFVGGICLVACRTGAPDDDDSAGAGGLAGGGQGGFPGEDPGGVGGLVDAATPAGGSGGADMPMAGSGGSAPSPGACQDHPVCDDFETYEPGAFKAGQGWSVSVEGASMEVDESRARSGRRSIKITVPAGGGKHALLGTSDRTVLSTGKSAYARMMVFLDAIPSGQRLHWSFMRASGFHMQDGKAGLMVHSIGGQPARLRNLMLWPTNEGLMDCANDSFTQIPSQQWTCVEWHLDPETQTMEVWLDGVKQSQNSWTTKPSGGGCILDQTNGDWVIPKISILQFGWMHHHSINGATMWIDDIGLDTKRIGCAGGL